MLYSINGLGGRRVLATYAQAPVPALALGSATTGGFPAQTAGLRSKALGWCMPARRRTGSLPRAPP